MHDHETIGSSATAIIDAPRENSITQARWIMMPLFALWIMFFVAGGMSG